MTKIIVVIKNGGVEEVDGIPTDVYLEVRNYDVKNTDEEFLSKDEKGRVCEIHEWRPPE